MNVLAPPQEAAYDEFAQYAQYEVNMAAPPQEAPYDEYAQYAQYAQQ